MQDQHAARPPQDYQPPQVIKVGSFSADTKGSYSKPNSDDSDAGQYYA